jgi:RpiR family transcriptional regulator, carbohydrate utilization regulator
MDLLGMTSSHPLKLGSDPSGNRLLQQIRAQAPTFPPAEARVAAVILHSPAWVLNNTLAAVAARAAVSEPTVIRFCRSVGLDGFQTLRLRLAHALAQADGFLPQELTATDSGIELTRKIFARAAATLTDVAGHFAGSEIERAIHALTQARRIEFYGLGSSGIVADDARHKFFRLGLQAIAYSDPHVHGLAATMLTERDVVVAVSSTGRTIDLIASIELARESKACVIAITPPHSPLAERADIVLPILTDEDTDIYTPMTTRLAQLTLIDVLSVGVALRLGPELSERLAKAHRSLTDKRLTERD